MSLSRKALEAIHDQFAEQAFRFCAMGQEIEPQFFAIHADETGRILSVTSMSALLHMLLRDEAGKEAFARLLPQFLGPSPLRDELGAMVGFRPNVLVQINECWIGQGPYVPPSERTDRREGIAIILHQLEESVVVLHVIETEPTRHAVRSPFPSEKQLAGGRMTMQGIAAEQATKH